MSAMLRLRKLIKKLSLVLLLVVVTSCGQSTQVILNECLWAETIRLSNDDIDVISDDLVEKLLLHNEKYEEFCDDTED